MLGCESRTILMLKDLSLYQFKNQIKSGINYIGCYIHDIILHDNKVITTKHSYKLAPDMDLLYHNYNPGHNILEHYNILVHVRFTASKTKLDIQYGKLGIHVASLTAERIKTQDLRKSGNIRKFSNLGGHIAQCPVSPFPIPVPPHRISPSPLQIPCPGMQPTPDINLKITFFDPVCMAQ